MKYLDRPDFETLYATDARFPDVGYWGCLHAEIPDVGSMFMDCLYPLFGEIYG